MHPLIRLHSLLAFILLLALAGGSGLLPALFLLVLLYGRTGLMHVGGLYRLVRRIRWLLFSILVLYGWWTPGEPLWDVPGLPAPSLDGLWQGAERVGVLLAIVAAVHWVMSVTERNALLGAVIAFTAPLRWLGVDHQRLAVRIQLTLEAVPRVQEVAAGLGQAGGEGSSRLARLAARARDLYGRVLAQARAEPVGIREVPETGPVPAWQWIVPIAVALLLWSGGRAATRLLF